MQLLEWIKATRNTQRYVANATGIHTSRICRIIKGEDPLLHEVLAIEDCTKKKVRAADWIQRLRDKGIPSAS